MKKQRGHITYGIPLNLSTQEQEKRGTNRAAREADRIWEMFLGPKQSTPWPPEWGLDKEEIELAQSGRAKMLDTMKEGSVYMARSATRKSYRYQSRNPELPAERYGVDYMLERLPYEKQCPRDMGRCAVGRARDMGRSAVGNVDTRGNTMAIHKK